MNIFKNFKEKMKQSKTKRTLYFTLFGIFCAIFIVAAIFTVDYFIESAKQKSRYNELSSDKNQVQQIVDNAPTTPSGDLDPNGDYPFDLNSAILPEYQDAHSQNNDLIGWIRIDGTVIDYPVMWKPTEKDYYLERNFDEESSKHGCIYVREQCDPLKPSDNLIIYGHYKQDGSMFHDLHGYYKQSFWKEHQFIEFDTIYAHHTYQIIAVFKTNVSSSSFYPYHRFNDAASAEEFDQFVSDVKSMSFYDTGVTAQYGDKLITLSTCEYTLSNGRLVVVAKQVS